VSSPHTGPLPASPPSPPAVPVDRSPVRTGLLGDEAFQRRLILAGLLAVEKDLHPGFIVDDFPYLPIVAWALTPLVRLPFWVIPQHWVAQCSREQKQP